MTEIRIDKFTNGYSLIVYDKDNGYLVREIASDKLQVLKRLCESITEMIERERNNLMGAL